MEKKTSQKKIESNRRNALKSTGPKTSEGKEGVKWNALKHGLLSKVIVLRSEGSGETEADFAELLTQLREDVRPEGVLEEMLVEKIAICYWRLRRAIRCEVGEIRRNQAIVALQLKKLNIDQSVNSLPQKGAVDKILRYETAIERQLYRAISELERLQGRRRGEVAPPSINVEVSRE